jgi:hypothetical protein
VSDRDGLVRLLEDHDKEADESGQFTAEIDFGCCADAILESTWLAEHDAELLGRAALVANSLRKREIDMHMTDFDSLPDYNRYFVLGAEEMSRQILALGKQRESSSTGETNA